MVPGFCAARMTRRGGYTTTEGAHIRRLNPNMLSVETADKSRFITLYTTLIILVGVVIRLGYYSLDRSL